MKLIFSRHGESEANQLQIISNRDLPHHLTEPGRSQSMALAERLAVFDLRAIYASPILRAQQTARIVAERFGLPVQTSAALREFDCGDAEGRSDAAAWRAHHALVAAWDAGDYEQRIPGGESFADLRARFLPFVRGILEQDRQATGDILLVSHGSMLHQMLPLLCANIDRAFTEAHPLSTCSYVVAAPQPERVLCLEWDGRQFDA